MHQAKHWKHWGDYDIRSVKLEGQAIVVLTRHRSKLGGAVRMRWWLSYDQDAWKIYDWEDIDMGLRVSTLMGLGFGQVHANLVGETMAMRDALNAVFAQDIATADRCLDRVNVGNLPKLLAGAHHMLRGIVRLRQERFAECLACSENAERCHADMPGIELLRTLVYNRLRRFDLALIHGERYRAIVGDDPDICFELGFATQEQRRFREAAAWYRKVLDEEPNHETAFLSLLRCLGGPEGDKNFDIGERFLKLERPQDHFDQCARDRRNFGDASTLEQLALAMRKRDPRHAEAEFCLALARMELLRPEEALTAMKAALQLQDLRRPPPRLLPRFCPNRHAARQHGASLCRLARSAAGLPRIGERAPIQGGGIARADRSAHPETSGRSVRAAVSGRAMSMAEERYEMAAHAYRKAFSTITDDVFLEAFRFNYVLSRYHVGDGRWPPIATSDRGGRRFSNWLTCAGPKRKTTPCKNWWTYTPRTMNTIFNCRSFGGVC